VMMTLMVKPDTSLQSTVLLITTIITIILQCI
jgi:hypothetical protein